MISKNELRKRLIAAGIAGFDDFKGCSDDEIVALEKRVGLSLPQAYKNFLKFMGKGAGEFMSDVDVFYSKLDGCQKFARELESLGCVTFPKNSFVIAERLAAVCFFFVADGMNQDPPIHRWSEGSSEFELNFYPSIWGLLEDELNSHET